MDSQDVLMKRLAAASHNKIYPSILPKSELQLRRILLTTRLWNEVRRQQALVFTSLQDDWLFSQEDADQLPSPGDTSLDEELDPLNLSILCTSSSSPDDSMTPKNQHHQDELDDDDDDDEEEDDDEDTKCTWLDDNIINENNNMEQDVKKPYDWTWLDDGTKESDHEAIPLVTSPFTTLSPSSSSSSMNDYDSLEKASSINKSRKRSSSSPEILTKSDSALLDLESSPRKRIKMKSPSSSSSPSSNTFTLCTPSTSSVSSDSPAGPRSPPTPTSPVLLSV